MSKYLDEFNLIAEEEQADLRGVSRSFYVHDSDKIRIQFYH
jgi:hypothetical protein